MFKTNRRSQYPIEPPILNRWSSRAFSNEPVSKEELFTLFDAARWAQNSYNNQPWRFIYSQHNSSSWNNFVDLLAPANKIWAQHASILVLVISKKTFDYNGKPSRTHGFDTGAAAQNMALQAAAMNIVAHGLEGFDYDAARKICAVPEEYEIHALFALGKPGNPDKLPEELAAREKPSDRKPVEETAFEASFAKKAY